MPTLTSYLTRIGYTGPIEPTLDVLCAVHRAHLLTISYENLDIHLGRPVTLDLPTIFDKIGESLPLHYVSASYRTRQPWGSVNLYGEHRNYILDGSKRNTSLGANFDVRVFRGLSVNMGANYNWIRDQIYLPRGEQNQADVLLRRRALQTGFEYELFGGLSYTFGSIFNNVVNSRF